MQTQQHPELETVYSQFEGGDKTKWGEFPNLKMCFLRSRVNHRQGWLTVRKDNRIYFTCRRRDNYHFCVFKMESSGTFRFECKVDTTAELIPEVKLLYSAVILPWILVGADPLRLVERVSTMRKSRGKE